MRTSMNKKITIPTVLFIIVLTVSFTALSQEKAIRDSMKSGHSNAKIVLYYRYDCPHCEKVEEFIGENGVDDKIDVARKEVHDTDNANELIAKAEFCQISGEDFGVPFLWDGENGKCIIGDKPIIAFFQNKLGQGAAAGN